MDCKCSQADSCMMKALYTWNQSTPGVEKEGNSPEAANRRPTKGDLLRRRRRSSVTTFLLYEYCVPQITGVYDLAATALRLKACHGLAINGNRAYAMTY